MQSSGGAAIPMRQDFDVEYVIGSPKVEAALSEAAALPPFSEQALQFLSVLSGLALKDAEGHVYPDVVTFGFWCRKASLMKQRAMYDDLSVRLGRGVVFHVAPSNVAVNFAYSCVAAFLAGNASVVRLPSKKFPQVDIFCRLWREALAQVPELQQYFLFVRYGHEDEVNARYSSLADTRVIWGGDETIRRFRQYPLKPRANEVTFADRFSLAVIEADRYMASEGKDALAQAFYNDTYLSDQQACTSPHLVVWFGERTAEARRAFWERLHDLVAKEYDFSAVQAVDKYDALLRLGAEMKLRQVKMEDQLVVRAEAEKLTPRLMEVRTGSGFFVEYIADDLAELYPVWGTMTQTVSYFGFTSKEIQATVMAGCPRGVDRIVPIGHTLDFSLFWDGYDLIRSMSRVVGVV